MAEKIRTPMQDKFLDALFGPANGDFRLAMEIAGFAPSASYNHLLLSLKDEIIERTKTMLAFNAPKAAMSVLDVIDNPEGLSKRTKLKASTEVLDRVNIAKNDTIAIAPSGGVFYLPLKDKDDGATESGT